MFAALLLQIASNIIERRDFTVIFPFSSKIRSDFADFYRDFLPALASEVNEMLINHNTCRCIYMHRSYHTYV